MDSRRSQKGGEVKEYVLVRLHEYESMNNEKTQQDPDKFHPDVNGKKTPVMTGDEIKENKREGNSPYKHGPEKDSGSDDSETAPRPTEQDAGQREVPSASDDQSGVTISKSNKKQHGNSTGGNTRKRKYPSIQDRRKRMQDLWLQL